jgi:MFS family permease
VIKITLLAASMLIMMMSATISPVLPTIQNQFQDTPNVALLVRLVLTLPALFIAIIAPFAGLIIDRIGRKRVLIVSTLIYGLTGTASYFAPSLEVLLISRAILGISVGGIMTSVSTLIVDYYTGKDRASFMGLQAGVMGFGGTVFVALGGLLADVSWRNPFLVYLSAFIVLPFVILVLYEPTEEEHCTDPLNPLAEPGACVAESIRVKSVVEHPPTENVHTPVGLIAFIYSIMIGTMIIFYIVPVQLPFHLAELTGASASQSGMAISVLLFSYAISSLQYGRVKAHLDHIQVLILAFGITAAGLTLVSIANGWTLIVIGLLLKGIGMGLLVPNLNVWVAEESPVAIRGRVMGGFTTALFLGQFLSPIISQPVSTAYGLSAGFLFAGLLLWLLVPLFFATRRRLELLTSH